MVGPMEAVEEEIKENDGRCDVKSMTEVEVLKQAPRLGLRSVTQEDQHSAEDQVHHRCVAPGDGEVRRCVAEFRPDRHSEGSQPFDEEEQTQSSEDHCDV